MKKHLLASGLAFAIAICALIIVGSLFGQPLTPAG